MASYDWWCSCCDFGLCAVHGCALLYWMYFTVYRICRSVVSFLYSVLTVTPALWSTGMPQCLYSATLVASFARWSFPAMSRLAKPAMQVCCHTGGFRLSVMSLHVSGFQTVVPAVVWQFAWGRLIYINWICTIFVFHLFIFEVFRPN